YDGSEIVLRFSDADDSADRAADLKQRYLWGQAVDQLFAQEDVTDLVTEGRLLWALGDNLGTIRDMAEYDSGTNTTTVANHVTYDAFGNITHETQTYYVDQLFGFTSRPLDRVTGLQNNLHRWYDAATGQWTAPDPIEADQQNTYRYVFNTPTSAVDPDG